MSLPWNFAAWRFVIRINCNGVSSTRRPSLPRKWCERLNRLFTDEKEVQVKPRYGARKKTTCKVTLSSGARVGEGQVLDLTVLGCQLETAFPLERGQSVQLRVHVDGQRPMRIDLGVVRWVKQGKAGIEFIRMVGDDQLRLRLIVGHIERRPRSNGGWSVAPLCVGY